MVELNHQVTKAQRRAIEIRPVQLNKCIDAVVLFVYLSWCLGDFVVSKQKAGAACDETCRRAQVIVLSHC